jgi:hypothetical protein
MTVREIGNRLELFVDSWLLAELRGARLQLQTPQLMPAGDAPPDPGHYATVILDGDTYRLWHRGPDVEGPDAPLDYYCYEESRDGIHWVKPDLGMFTVNVPTGSGKAMPLHPNNVVLANMPHFGHNLSPFLDAKPGTPPEERFKAMAGSNESGLHPFVSPDGLRWTKRDGPVITFDAYAFDSQNVAFWSELEQCYVCYYRTWEHQQRSIRRATSHDFIHWAPGVRTEANLPGEHLYTSATHPYYRAPHIYIALPTRLMEERGCSTDILLMSSRGGPHFDRTFHEALIRPGLDPAEWSNRANYAAQNVVPTGPAEMSIYVRGRRYALRTDGFVALNAGYGAGEALTHPLVFAGRQLLLNYATSASGALRVELQDAEGHPLPGFALSDCPPLIGNEIERPVAWSARDDLSAFAGSPIRLRFALQDADLFSVRFR